MQYNFEGCSSTGQILDLLPRDHQFESHKPQGLWKLIWLLILGSVGLVEMHTSWADTHDNKKKYKNYEGTTSTFRSVHSFQLPRRVGPCFDTGEGYNFLSTINLWDSFFFMHFVITSSCSTPLRHVFRDLDELLNHLGDVF